MIKSGVLKSEVGNNLQNSGLAPPVLHVPLPNMVLGKAFAANAMATRLKSHQVLRTRVCAIVTFLSIASQHVTRMMMMMISDNGGFYSHG